jgi:hypothetical protein
VNEGAAAGVPERRHSTRFHVVLPVTLDGTTGSTRDVSAAGVFLTFLDRPAQPLDTGAQIRLGLVLEHADPRGLLDVHCEGTVVRVERTADTVSVAVRFDSYQFDPACLTANRSPA